MNPIQYIYFYFYNNENEDQHYLSIVYFILYQVELVYELISQTNPILNINFNLNYLILLAKTAVKKKLKV